jgi:uncharacterized membrane protein
MSRKGANAMNKRRAIISSVLTVFLVGVTAWAFGFFSRTDAAVAELQQLGSQMRDKNLPDAQRSQLRTDFRQRMESMTDDQRRAFFNANREQWDARNRERMDEYFAMSKADQRKRLDEILNRMVQSQNSQQPNANGQSNRGGRNMSDAQRDERSKRRLDRTTPKMRAQFAEFRKQLDKRAQERGVQLSDHGGGGFGGFRRGV